MPPQEKDLLTRVLVHLIHPEKDKRKVPQSQVGDVLKFVERGEAPQRREKVIAKSFLSYSDEVVL